MPNLRQLGLPLLLIALLSACAMNESAEEKNVLDAMTIQKGKPLPKPDPGFKAADVLPYTPLQVYVAAIEVLDAHRIFIAYENKTDGRISTDYVNGPSYVTAYGMLGGYTLRYKYLITLKKVGEQTKLNVTAYLESTRNEGLSWRNVSNENPTQVQDLQNVLIELIEHQLATVGKGS